LNGEDEDVFSRWVFSGWYPMWQAWARGGGVFLLFAAFSCLDERSPPPPGSQTFLVAVPLFESVPGMSPSPFFVLW